MTGAVEPARTWLPLGRSALRRPDRWRRQLRLGVHGAVARAIGPMMPFEAMLVRALERESRRGGGFFLPTPYALRCFGDALTIDVPTAALRRRLTDWACCGRVRVHVADYFLGGGDWEALAHPFVSSSVAEEARQLAEHGLDYRTTPAYADYLARLAAGRPMTRNQVRLDSPALVDAYFQRFVGLFESVRRHGVLSLASARQAVPALACRSGVRRSASELVEQELGIAIGHDGELLRLPGGQHRTAIAMVLGVPSLPVQVRLVHAQWLRGALRRHDDTISAVHHGIADIISQRA